jgi:hypothetical protein
MSVRSGNAPYIPISGSGIIRGFTVLGINSKKCLKFEVPKVPEVVNNKEFSKNLKKRPSHFAVRVIGLSAPMGKSQIGI